MPNPEFLGALRSKESRNCPWGHPIQRPQDMGPGQPSISAAQVKLGLMKILGPAGYTSLLGAGEKDTINLLPQRKGLASHIR